jgi:hypothetical protein
MSAKPLDRTFTWEAFESALKNCCGAVMLGHGKYTLVDEDRMGEVERHNWRLSSNGYAKRAIGPYNKRKPVYLHRYLMGEPDGWEVDHKNRNKIDNRVSNLRICSRSQNAGNTSVTARNKTSRYKGVRKQKGRSNYEARGRAGGVQIHIGSFSSEVEAAKAYNDWARIAFGEFARLNVIE